MSERLTDGVPPKVWYHRPITVKRVVEIAETLASDEGDYQNNLLVELVAGFGVYGQKADPEYHHERAYFFIKALYGHTIHANHSLYDYLMGLGVASEVGEAEEGGAQ